MPTTVLAVTGLSPAIVTETVWALAHEKKRVLPERVVFITTAVGAERIREQLFSPLDGFGGRTAWECLRAALRAKDHELIAEPARIIGQGNRKTGVFEGLSDIVTPEQNDLAASFILEQVRQVVTNPETRLIASIAGGRKTMGALLHAAVTLIGRETDRLTHVLVDAPFETMPGFYFPGQPGPALRDREGREFAPSAAGVHLADVPFVPLRNRFEDIREFPGTFDGLRRKFGRELKEDAARPRLVEISYRSKTLWIDSTAMPMRVKALAVLHFLSHAQKSGRTPIDQPAAAEAMTSWLRSADFIPLGIRPNHIEPEDIRHELNHLRTVLKQSGFEIARRSLQLPPHTLHLRE